MARYDTEIDMANANSSHPQIADLIGHHKTVLDVGCATGYLARQLKQADCEVFGIDNDAEAAEQARDDLVELVVGDLERESLTDHFKRGYFDAVVFGDVLEHLLDPERVLADAVELLNDSGRILVSIPNVAHGSVRLSLLHGAWRYTNTGLLDSTHVRFFTRESVFDLLEGAGLEVEALRATVFDPLAADVEVESAELPSEVVEWVRDQPDALAYQFIASARRLPAGAKRRPRPNLVPALPFDQVRRRDEHTTAYREQLELADRELEARHRLMTMRDHVVGLEASAATAQSAAANNELRARRAEARLERVQERLAKARRRTKRAEARAAKLEAKLRRLRRESARERNALVSSRTWRVGRVMTWPGRLLRGGAERG